MVSIYVNYPKNSKMCTDTSWLCLFIVFWIFLMAITVFAFVYGNYLPIINGYDSFGNICGTHQNKHYENFSLSGTDTSEKPLMVFFAIDDIPNAVKICSEYCLNIIIFTAYDLFTYSNDVEAKFCRYDFDLTYLIKFKHIQYLDRLGPCHPRNYQRSDQIKHRCTPRGTISDTKEFYSHLNSGSVQQLFFVYIYLAWYYIAILGGIALGMSVILLVLMHCLTRAISWLIYFLAIAANAGLCALLWHVYDNVPLDKRDEYNEYYYKPEGEHYEEEAYEISFYLLKDFLLNKKVIYMGAILTSVTTLALILAVLLLTRKFPKHILLFKEAGNCLVKFPGLITIPLMSLLVFTVYLSISVYTLLCITTSSYLEMKPIMNYRSDNKSKFDDNFRSFHQLEYTELTFIHQSFYVYVVGFVWTIEFLFACEEFTLGAAVTYWCFRRQTHSPVLHATGTLFRYHLGTVVKGSIAISLFKVPRLIVTYVCQTFRNCGCHSYAKRCNSIIDTIEEWLGVVDHNAYGVVAMEAVDFIPAGVIAWNKMRRTAMEVKAIKRVADFVLFLAKLVVATVTCIIAILLLRDKGDLIFYMAPVLLSTLIAFFIAHIVLSVYEMLIDTLCSCSCEENETYSTGARSILTNLAEMFDKKGSTNKGRIQFIRVRPIDRSTT